MNHCLVALKYTLWSSNSSSATHGILMVVELYSVRFTVFPLALGYCFIFYTGGLFFYDHQPVNFYFHKLFQTVYHMVRIGHSLIFDQRTLSTFECADEKAPKSVIRLFCNKMF